MDKFGYIPFSNENFFMKDNTLPFGNDDGIGKPLEDFEPPSEIESPTKCLEIPFLVTILENKIKTRNSLFGFLTWKRKRSIRNTPQPRRETLWRRFT